MIATSATCHFQLRNYNRAFLSENCFVLNIDKHATETHVLELGPSIGQPVLHVLPGNPCILEELFP